MIGEIRRLVREHPLFIRGPYRLFSATMTLRPLFISIYLLALFFTGLAYLAALPPFEGFDEPAHYSSIRQIAATGAIPLYGASRLDRSVVDYQGPVAYGSGLPPFDQGLVYPKFFADPERVESYLKIYRHSAWNAPYGASEELNWQAQHPPLYYLLMAPLLKAVGGLSFVGQIFVLRLFSFLLALAGVAFGIFAIKRRDPGSDTSVPLLGFVLYPVVLPMFFPEFTRIGNDSLCILWVGMLTYFLSLWLSDPGSRIVPSLAMGITLGAGLLTKAFFLPISAALAVFLLMGLRYDDRNAEARSRRMRGLVLIFVPAVLIGAGWYVRNMMAYGDVVGGASSIQLGNRGGLIANLAEHFSAYALLRGVGAMLVTYLWGGTWSLAHLPAWLYGPLLATLAWIAASFVLEGRRRPAADPLWLPVWMLAFFGGGLLWNAIITMAITGSGNTPGWYLHILMPLAAIALGAGAHRLLRHGRGRALFIALLFYSAFFQLIAFWAQLALYTGCAAKADDKSYVFSGKSLCVGDVSLLIDRLAVIGWPGLMAAGWGGALICVLWLWKLSSQERPVVRTA
jgi:hypothetical protein